MIEFTVYGEPRGKGRPRARNAGNFIQIYTDSKTASYENLVRLSYLEAGAQKYFNGEELAIRIDIYQSIPKSTSKAKRFDMMIGHIKPTKKPDVDNVVKAILDGLNKVAFADDTQIVQLYAEKHYSDEPKVEVKIKERNTTQ